MHRPPHTHTHTALALYLFRRTERLNHGKHNLFWIRLLFDDILEKYRWVTFFQPIQCFTAPSNASRPRFLIFQAFPSFQKLNKNLKRPLRFELFERNHVKSFSQLNNSQIVCFLTIPSYLSTRLDQ